MAAPITPEQYAIFRWHTDKFPEMAACPICKTREWGIAGIESGVAYSMEYHCPDPSGPSTPILTAICRKCFFVRSFSWVGIMQAYEKERAGG